MTILQLKCFLGVIKNKNFAKTASALGMTQSVFSKQIKGLEEEFHVKFFERSTRDIEPTNAGISFYPHAKYIMKQYNEMFSQMQEYLPRQRMKLNIASMFFIQQYHILEGVHEFRKTYPNIEIALSEQRALEVQEALDKGQTDIAIIYAELLQRQYPKVIPIKEDKMVAVMNKDHSLAWKDRVSLKELKNESFIMMKGDSQLHYYLMLTCIDAGFVANEINVNLRLETMKSYLRENQAVTLLMRSMAEDLVDNTLVLVPIRENKKLTLSVVVPTETPSTACEKFLAYIEDFKQK
ncbi:LysR family transcriptional regulator [Petroclostridium sp. X23]|uniref:LysR family transcriptional regulator n=1 Tax=Petroclostridium sp. X23 TaxID=3045146 RepID=UPI0024ACF98D|nr:LysR family transcriptional regulator [Petroclostridium sp. X23]WHH60625.1 LysR family transcriptional regulator [Petroclostridium sp. X23]